ncbi:MAG: D-alanyl-D-alanine carboxypeptidase [Lactobacillus sp.]|jgi:D-alanyl-D-alanine carboxypeptidase (penicillin-binding protein 5/6)|nr:D-alanyl-D-alanine carboxypeptidase [Lactobacillus sp.]
MFSRIFTLTFILLLLASGAQAIETTARNVILMDSETGQYLFVKDHMKKVPPASMSKLMTVYVIFEKLKNGSLSVDDEFTVSENAWRQGGAASGGSTMFLPIKARVKVGDLLKGIIIQSGNDACITVAENIAGSEEKFAEDMNKKAQEIGLENSLIANSTGLPHPDHRMSVEDLAKLSRILIEEFPEYYPLFSETSFIYNNIRQGNRNPLLYSMQYADGLKTGHTEEAGFCLTASAKKGSRRLIAVMTGMSSNKERAEESNKIMSWGFREFDNYTILKGNRKIATIPVWHGQQKNVDLIVPSDIRQTIHRSTAQKIKLTAVYNTPARAPIKKGDKLGSVKIDMGDGEINTIDLVAAQDVEEKGFFGRLAGKFRYIFFGAM